MPPDQYLETARGTARGTPTDNNATSDGLRVAIDRGHGADKVDFPDPAAAPLGTDDEAAGQPPSPAAVQTAFNHEVRRTSAAEQQEPELSRTNSHWLTVLVSWGGLATLSAIGLALALA